MKNKILLSFLALSLTFAPAVAVEEMESIISVEASKTSEIAPDTATLRFYVENSGVNLSDLKEKNDKIVNTAINAIKAKLKPDESIKTIAFSVNNVYSYKDKIRIFQKYEVKNGFEVKLKDLSKISEIIDIAMNNGIKNIGQLSFSVADGEKACNDAMAEAIKIAKNRAQYLSQTSGNQLLKVKSINPYCSLNNNVVPRYYSNAMLSKAQDSSEGATTVDVIEPGTINIRAGVNMTYYLK